MKRKLKKHPKEVNKEPASNGLNQNANKGISCPGKNKTMSG